MSQIFGGRDSRGMGGGQLVGMGTRGTTISAGAQGASQGGSQAGSQAGAPAPGGFGGTGVKDVTIATFMQEVIEASMDVPIIVDFWAPWCGPCKQLGPLLEKTVAATKGAVRMVKVNTDDPTNEPLVRQLQIQSIPAVYAFIDRRPVDAFMGALPESQIKNWVQQIAMLKKDGPAAALQEAVEAAKLAFTEGDLATAQNIYEQILQRQPDHVPSLIGLARVALAQDDVDGAKALADAIPTTEAKDQEVISLRSAIELADQAGEAAAGLRGWEDRLKVDPADHEARIDYALALFASGRRQEAIDHLLISFKADREWNDQAARKQLLKFFEALGPGDPLTVAGRKRLSSMMFS